MLKYKKHRFASVLKDKEELNPILAGSAGKNRRLVSIATTKTSLVYIRVYRDAEQIVDFDSYLLTASAPFLAMDLPLAEGQQCNVGFYNGSAGNVTNQDIMVGYEEAE